MAKENANDDGTDGMNYDVDASGIPDELKTLDRWVCWQIPEYKDNDDKVPYQPRTDVEKPAKTSVADTWGSFDDALEAANAREGWGVGFIFGDHTDKHDAPGPYIGIDVDSALDDDGNLRDWVTPLDKFEGVAWVERSVGGEGLHIVLRVEDGDGTEYLPEWWTNVGNGNHKEVAAFTGGRFFTVTGDTWGPGLPSEHDPDDPDNATEAELTDEIAAPKRIEDWLTGAWLEFKEKLPLVDSGSSSDSKEDYQGGDWFDEDAAEDALEYIDNNCGYEEWRDIGYGLADAFGDATAERLFKSWSRGCSQWDSDAPDKAENIIRKADDPGTADITAAKVVYEGKKGGWDVPSAGRSDGSNSVEVVEPDGTTDERELPEPHEFALYGGEYGWWNQSEDPDEQDEWRRVTNWQVETNYLLDIEYGENDVEHDVTIYPSDGHQPYDTRIAPSDYNTKREFKDAILGGGSTTFRGGEKQINQIKRFIAGQDVPRLTGTPHMGLHSDEWVLPTGVLTPDGWGSRNDSADVDHTYIEGGMALENKIALDPERDDADFDTEAVAEACELLPQLRNFDRFGPVIGWFYASAFRPLIMEETGQFNLLNITGETGSGKTESVRALWKLFGTDGDPLDGDTTYYTAMKNIGASNALPVWFDEYKPSDMRSSTLDGFLSILRKSTSGMLETRGNHGGSDDIYSLRAPVCISGEGRINGSAEERRTIFTSFKKDVTRDAECVDAYARLTGDAADDPDGDGKRHYEGVDPTDHAFAFYRHIADMHDNEAIAYWRKSGERVAEILDEENVDTLEDLVEQGLQTIHFGLQVFRHFAVEHGAEDPLTDEQIKDAIMYVAEDSYGGANREDHIDALFNVASRAASEDYLELDKHYQITHAGSGGKPTEVRINLSKSFDKVRQYADDHGVPEDLLNSKDDYRERLQQAVEDTGGYVLDRSVAARRCGRSVAIQAERASNELVDFALPNFDGSLDHEVEVDIEVDDDGSGGGDGDSGSGGSGGMEARTTPLSGLDPEGTNGFVDLTVKVARVMDEPAPWLEAEGTLVDEGGMLNYVSREQPLDTEFAEGECYLIENAEIGKDGDGAHQIQLDGRVASATKIDQGVGHTEGDDPGPNATIDESADGHAAADGGEVVEDSDDDGGQQADADSEQGGDDDGGADTLDELPVDVEALSAAKETVMRTVAFDGPIAEPALFGKVTTDGGLDKEVAEDALAGLLKNDKLYRAPPDQKIDTRT